MPCPYVTGDWYFSTGSIFDTLVLMGLERKITRLRNYDYRQNDAYSFTICSYHRRCVFSRISNGILHLHPFGQIVDDCWNEIPSHFPQVILDEFIIMPNHIHGILFIDGEAPPDENTPRKFGQPQSGSLGTIIGSFKSGVTNRISKSRGTRTHVWQPGFHEHIIRHDRDLQHQREYIQNNPSRWESDEFFAAFPTPF